METLLRRHQEQIDELRNIPSLSKIIQIKEHSSRVPGPLCGQIRYNLKHRNYSFKFKGLQFEKNLYFSIKIIGFCYKYHREWLSLAFVHSFKKIYF